MKILITGGCGFVGSNLALFLKKKIKNSRIFTLDNLSRKGSDINRKRLKISKDEWLQKSLLWKKKYPIVLQDHRVQKKFVNPYFFMEKLSKHLSKDDVVVRETPSI